MRTFRIIAAVLLSVLAGTATAAGLGWSVHDDEGNRMYLVGTVHVADASFYPLPEAIVAALDRSTILVMEVDPAQLDPADMQRLVRRHGLLHGPESLRAMLSESTWRELSAGAERVGLRARDLNGLRPWLAATTLVAAGLSRHGFDRALGMEEHFLARADGRMPLVALESPEQQVLTLARLSDVAQVAFLESALVDDEEFVESVRAILDAWHRGDVDAMSELLLDTYIEHEELYDAVIRVRNEAWMPELRTMIATGKTHFVAVGALHLVGPDGLLELLAREGFRLERLLD